MTIQINTDNHITAHENYRSQLSATISAELERYSEHITRVEVHLADENGSKTGQNDKRCILEARVEGRPAVAVTSHGNTYDQAVNTALDKLNAALGNIFDRLKNHHAATPEL